MENFRQKWQQDLTKRKKSSSGQALNPETEEEESIEEKARNYFLEGVEHEQNGELFEAIQKYRKAINLVPDIEFKAHEHTLRRRNVVSQIPEPEKVDEDNTDTEVEELPEDVEDTEDDQVEDLLMRFSKMKLKKSLCEPEVSTNGLHISSLPMEVLINILKWVVSSDLDLKSLENFSQACRGFFVASRASDIWRRVCIQTWGLAGLPLEEPGLGGWRTLFLTRPRVNFNGCYISRVTYLREGERGFQDNEFYKSWHVVHYYRILRFFPGARVLMVTTAEQPAVAVKLLNSRDTCAIQGCMFGHYKTVNDRVHCVLQSQKIPVTSNRRYSFNKRKKQHQNSYYEVPEQDFHLELEIGGKKNRQLTWLCYRIISKYKNGAEQVSDLDITNLNNYPVLLFSRVKSYTSECNQPLN